MRSLVDGLWSSSTDFACLARMNPAAFTKPDTRDVPARCRETPNLVNLISRCVVRLIRNRASGAAPNQLSMPISSPSRRHFNTPLPREGSYQGGDALPLGSNGLLTIA